MDNVVRGPLGVAFIVYPTSAVSRKSGSSSAPLKSFSIKLGQSVRVIAAKRKREGAKFSWGFWGVYCLGSCLLRAVLVLGHLSENIKDARPGAPVDLCSFLLEVLRRPRTAEALVPIGPKL